MKRIALLACAVALLAAAAGCGQIKAGDGDLLDDWGMLAAAVVPEPAAGSCWTSTAVTVADLGYLPTTQQACDATHTFETVSVGHFTGEAAKGSTAPKGADLAAAWTECDKAADDFLGGQWQSGRVYVRVTPPPPTQWNGDARYFRCDVAALRTERGTFDVGTTTLKGALAGSGDLRLGCGTVVGFTSDSWDDITPAACTAAHDVEYVGTVSSPVKDYPADQKAYTAAFDGLCESQLLAYVGMKKTTWQRQTSLSFGYWTTGGKDGWAAGNHSARCYAMIDKKKISRSLKGAGDIQV